MQQIENIEREGLCCTTNLSKRERESRSMIIIHFSNMCNSNKILVKVEACAMLRFMDTTKIHSNLLYKSFTK